MAAPPGGGAATGAGPGRFEAVPVVFKVFGSPETNAFAFDSLREVARSLGKASSGQERQRIEAGFLRLFDATFLASDSRPNAIRRDR